MPRPSLSGRPARLARAPLHGRARLRGAPALLGLALAASHCGDGARPTGAPAPPAAASAPVLPPAATATTAAAASAATAADAAPFVLADLVDLRRKGVSRFGYAPATQTLFVSFSDPPKMADQPPPEEHSNELEQWDLTRGAMAFRYQLPSRWIADELFPSPDGKLLGGRLFGLGDGAWCRTWLVDTAAHRVVHESPCAHPDRSTAFLFDGAGHVAIRSTPQGSKPSLRILDASGQPATAAPGGFVDRAPCPRCSVIENAKGVDNAGLYYTDDTGERSLVCANHWHNNFALTADGKHVVTTTWDGEILVWSTGSKRVVSRQKWTQSYGYLAHDPPRDRFLIAEVVDSGTSFLRVLKRAP